MTTTTTNIFVLLMLRARFTCFFFLSLFGLSFIQHKLFFGCEKCCFVSRSAQWQNHLPYSVHMPGLMNTTNHIFLCWLSSGTRANTLRYIFCRVLFFLNNFSPYSFGDLFFFIIFIFFSFCVSYHFEHNARTVCPILSHYCYFSFQPSQYLCLLHCIYLHIITYY